MLTLAILPRENEGADHETLVMRRETSAAAPPRRRVVVRKVDASAPEERTLRLARASLPGLAVAPIAAPAVETPDPTLVSPAATLLSEVVRVAPVAPAPTTAVMLTPPLPAAEPTLTDLTLPEDTVVDFDDAPPSSIPPPPSGRAAHGPLLAHFVPGRCASCTVATVFSSVAILAALVTFLSLHGLGASGAAKPATKPAVAPTTVSTVPALPPLPPPSPAVSLSSR